MKKFSITKFTAVIASAVLLAGCGTSKSSASKPDKYDPSKSILENYSDFLGNAFGDYTTELYCEDDERSIWLVKYTNMFGDDVSTSIIESKNTEGSEKRTADDRAVALAYVSAVTAEMSEQLCRDVISKSVECKYIGSANVNECIISVPKNKLFNAEYYDLDPDDCRKKINAIVTDEKPIKLSEVDFVKVIHSDLVGGWDFQFFAEDETDLDEVKKQMFGVAEDFAEYAGTDFDADFYIGDFTNFSENYKFNSKGELQLHEE